MQINYNSTKGMIFINAELRKQNLLQLYCVMDSIKQTIEAEMDTLAEKGNTLAFQILLLEMVELTVKLLKSNS